MKKYNNIDLEQIKQITSNKFIEIRNEIRLELQKLEDEYNDKMGLERKIFEVKNWEREGGGGGEISKIRGNLFEQAGVNFSKVYGAFTAEMQKQIPGSEDDPNFFASGVSLVIHPRSPKIPIVHMNVRCISTKYSWFGGGSDLTPVFVIEEDKKQFHEAMKRACDKNNPLYYEKFSKECDEYFFIKHRNEPRGVGGIFYDYLNTGDFEKDFAFTQDVANAFIEAYPAIVRKHMFEDYTEEDKQKQLEKRGRYIEFNLVYDRGTKFGLLTGGNTEAIMMSIPPIAAWA